MHLLREITAGGYPTDYLDARVRGRRAALRAEQHRERAPEPSVAPSDEAIWDELLTEYDWLRRQMTPRLRRDFFVFWLFRLAFLANFLPERCWPASSPVWGSRC